jgi:NAD(P)-dependent dehydrogenase (short-subunit alcohol dehydrogenase family)
MDSTTPTTEGDLMSTQRAAIVTGGTRGIGYACVKRLRDAGFSVLTCSRSQDEVDRVVAELDADGPRVVGMRANLGDPGDCDSLVQRCVDEFGRIDALVNNAALYASRPFLEITQDHWDEHLEANLRGPALLSIAVAKHMRDQGGGRIVHVSSDNALAAEPDFAAYTVAKTGLLGLTRSMAVDLARYNIITNCVLPGWTRTAMTEEHLGMMTQTDVEAVIPMGRAAEPAETAEVVAFLCDPKVTYVLGQMISVDGGLMAKQPVPRF